MSKMGHGFGSHEHVKTAGEFLDQKTFRDASGYDEAVDKMVTIPWTHSVGEALQVNVRVKVRKIESADYFAFRGNGTGAQRNSFGRRGFGGRVGQARAERTGDEFKVQYRHGNG